MTPSAPRSAKLLTLAAGLAVLFAPGLAQAQADGRPGNPPSTALGRAADRATGTPTTPDGTPGNPPGTALGRAADRATTPDGTPGNPPGTALGRAADRATTPDGTAGNPPGTALGRAADRAIGTSPTPDGTPGNPPGTALGRAATAIQPAAATTLGAATLARPRMSQLIGGNVYNDRNERIGEVEEILLSPPGTLAGTSGAGPTAIIQVGGFLGIGGRLVTLPLGDLRWNNEREQIVLPGATKESLGARPAFEYVMLRSR